MKVKEILSMLGLARRAGKVSMGHDMATKSICDRKAKMLLFSSDSSSRVQKELKVTIEKHNVDIPVFVLPLTIDEISNACGYRAGIITINDENFSKKIHSLIKEEI